MEVVTFLINTVVVVCKQIGAIRSYKLNGVAVGKDNFFSAVFIRWLLGLTSVGLYVVAFICLFYHITLFKVDVVKGFFALSVCNYGCQKRESQN
jgi:hypothetical protein